MLIKLTKSKAWLAPNRNYYSLRCMVPYPEGRTSTGLQNWNKIKFVLPLETVQKVMYIPYTWMYLTWRKKTVSNNVTLHVVVIHSNFSEAPLIQTINTGSVTFHTELQTCSCPICSAFLWNCCSNYMSRR